MSDIAGLLREIVSDYNCGDKVITTDKARVIRDAAREIERLTIEDPEFSRAVETLNKNQFKCGEGGGEWTLVQREDGLAASNGEIIMYKRSTMLTARDLESERTRSD